jgi:hypothetical protein
VATWHGGTCAIDHDLAVPASLVDGLIAETHGVSATLIPAESTATLHTGRGP